MKTGGWRRHHISTWKNSILGLEISMANRHSEIPPHRGKSNRNTNNKWPGVHMYGPRMADTGICLALHFLQVCVFVLWQHICGSNCLKGGHVYITLGGTITVPISYTATIQAIILDITKNNFRKGQWHGGYYFQGFQAWGILSCTIWPWNLF